MWEKLKQPVTIGFFLKLMITINLLAICFSFRLAYISDLEEEEEQEYITHLEERVELQHKLIDLQYELLNEYRN